jgi:hypothetical protein
MVEDAGNIPHIGPQIRVLWDRHERQYTRRGLLVPDRSGNGKTNPLAVWQGADGGSSARMWR